MADTYGNGSGMAAPSNDPSAPYYDAVRRRIQQTGQQNQQQNQDQVARQFASMGNLNSGEYVKQSEKTRQDTENTTQGQLSGVDLQQAQDNVQTQRIAQQEGFQASESEKSRLQNQDLFQQDLDFKKQVQGSNVHFQDLASALAQKEFDANSQTNYINSILGFANANIDPGKLSYITSSLNNLGEAPGGSGTANLGSISDVSNAFNSYSSQLGQLLVG